jgi:hypothetical protein
MEFDVVEITKGRVLKVWWCLLWRAYLGCLVVVLSVWGVKTAIKYCAFKLIGELSSKTTELIEIPCNAIGTLLLIYVSFVVVRFIFKKDFSDFKIVLAARDNQKLKDEQKQ